MPLHLLGDAHECVSENSTVPLLMRKCVGIEDDQTPLQSISVAMPKSYQVHKGKGVFCVSVGSIVVRLELKVIDGRT